MQSKLWAIGLLLLAIAGCWSESSEIEPKENVPPSPANVKDVRQAREEIFQKRLAVDTLYLTEDGGKIVAPGNSQNAIIDPATGKLAWEAWQCNNPQCPGRKPDGQPLLFPWINPWLRVNEHGTIAGREMKTAAEIRLTEEFGERKCPACLKTRNRAAETAEQRQQFQSWCRPHVLPQAAEQLKKLNEEHRRLLRRN